MNRDVRVSTTAPLHVKHKRFRALLRRKRSQQSGADAFGPFGVWASLICYAGRECPSGVFPSADDLELAVDWEASGGKAGELAAALIDSRLVDRLDDGRLVLHDWAEHNEWATHDPERSARQRLNAHMKSCQGPLCNKDYCPAGRERVAASGSASGSDNLPAGSQSAEVALPPSPIPRVTQTHPVPAFEPREKGFPTRGRAKERRAGTDDVVAASFAIASQKRRQFEERPGVQDLAAADPELYAAEFEQRVGMSPVAFAALQEKIEHAEGSEQQKRAG